MVVVRHRVRVGMRVRVTVRMAMGMGLRVRVRMRVGRIVIMLRPRWLRGVSIGATDVDGVGQVRGWRLGGIGQIQRQRGWWRLGVTRSSMSTATAVAVCMCMCISIDRCDLRIQGRRPRRHCLEVVASRIGDGGGV